MFFRHKMLYSVQLVGMHTIMIFIHTHYTQSVGLRRIIKFVTQQTADRPLINYNFETQHTRDMPTLNSDFQTQHTVDRPTLY